MLRDTSSQRQFKDPPPPPLPVLIVVKEDVTKRDIATASPLVRANWLRDRGIEHLLEDRQTTITNNGGKGRGSPPPSSSCGGKKERGRPQRRGADKSPQLRENRDSTQLEESHKFLPVQNLEKLVFLI
ncbi:hypothetical protein Q8A73_004135 [Channa argus]|nr:hypothetical protein Q8A73_004135 [Channa argus]